MKFKDLSEQQILELFESAPLKDFDLIYKFYKTYINVVKALCEALSGYGYQKDVYKLYNAFYAPQALSYASFSRLLGEMEEQGLIGSKNGNKKIVFMKQKAYALLWKNQTTIHASRLNNRAMKKSEQLTKLHLHLRKVFKAVYTVDYVPRFLKRSVTCNSFYIINSSTTNFCFLFPLKEKQKSEDLKAEIVNLLRVELEKSDKRFVHFVLVVDEDSKRYETAIEKLQNSSVLQYALSNNQLKIEHFKL